MFLVGLTGSIGTGKSTISQILLSLGVPIIDADAIARDVVLPNTKAWKRIRDSPVFGPEYFTAEGELDRNAVAKKVFADENSRIHLERIVHPEIRAEMIRKIIRHAFQGRHFVVLDVPLLFEKSPLLPFCHKVIVVTCSRQKQIERVKIRSKWTDEEIIRRTDTQMPQDEKIKRANYVIDNNGTISQTEVQVKKIYALLKASKFHWIVRGVFATGVLLLVGSIWAFVAFIRWIL
ncbi:hypothetical protein RvY_17845 [Ramazzottius varieornatus]|uniref:Dephospho-CoA kinase n=1 Tax=Ramazzottius varieornatus TaxID=947166 RepID=A0A1D1W9B1_RAMVA|nr:hypothetical protein RvY_17845 [Ramazzottius varieornatus]